MRAHDARCARSRRASSSSAGVLALKNGIDGLAGNVDEIEIHADCTMARRSTPAPCERRCAALPRDRRRGRRPKPDHRMQARPPSGRWRCARPAAEGRREAWPEISGRNGASLDTVSTCVALGTLAAAQRSPGEHAAPAGRRSPRRCRRRPASRTAAKRAGSPLALMPWRPTCGRETRDHAIQHRAGAEVEQPLVAARPCGATGRRPG